jgi:hypothetical protein
MTIILEPSIIILNVYVRVYEHPVYVHAHVCTQKKCALRG